MSVTGHKSVQSLSVYWRVSDEEKIQMGESLGMNLVPTSAPSMTAYTAPTNNTVFADTESALYEVQSMEHDVVEQLFSDFNEQESQKSILRPICFNNCTACKFECQYEYTELSLLKLLFQLTLVFFKFVTC